MINEEKAESIINELGTLVSGLVGKLRGNNGSMPLVDAIKLFDMIRRLKKQLQTTIKTPLEKAYDTLRFAIIPSKMEEMDITTVTVDGVGRCTVTDDVSVSAKDKGALMAWLEVNEFEDLITRSVNAQTLAAFVRRRLKAGEELPKEDVLKITPVVRASITKV